MHLTVFNGSPKLGENNTQVLIDAFAEGFNNDGGHTASVHKLNQFEDLNDAVKLYQSAEIVLLAFPLYSYAMPAGVKAFIEAMALDNEGLDHLQDPEVPRKKLGFLVQYGFKEAIHARPLEAYLIQLTEELGAEYIGTIIKGGCDGLAKMVQGQGHSKVLLGAKNLGYELAKRGYMNEFDLKQYASPETQSKSNRWLMKMVVALINRYYWKAELKKNSALKNSFDRSYGQ